MKARIKITLKNGVLDPQGKAIEGAIKGLGISGVGDVRQGKYIEVDLTESDPDEGPGSSSSRCARTCSPTRSSKTTATRSAEGRRPERCRAISKDSFVVPPLASH